MNIEKELTRNKTNYLAIPMAVFLLSAYSVLPGHIAAAASSFVAFTQCSLDDFNGEPKISMNSVLSTRSGSEVVKTIHVEKEIFFCCCTIQSLLPVTVDVTTYLEVFENLPSGKVFKAMALTTTCVKDESSGIVLGCTRGTEQADVNGNIVAPAEPTKDTSVIAAATGCEELDIDENANHVQDVNTVVGVVNPGIVKTVDAQKEAFLCVGNGEGGFLKKIDVVIFQDTIENLNTGSITQTWQTATCLVELFHASVEDCVFSTQSNL